MWESIGLPAETFGNGRAGSPDLSHLRFCSGNRSFWSFGSHDRVGQFNL